jgi:hypothetical protein
MTRWEERRAAIDAAYLPLVRAIQACSIGDVTERHRSRSLCALDEARQAILTGFLLREREALREQVLAKLTPEEREAFNVVSYDPDFVCGGK